jgi:hypothetical protein
LIKAFLKSHDDPDNVTIMGHRDLIRLTNSAPKACPCFNVAEFLIDYKIHDEEDALTDDDASPLAIPSVYTVKSGDSLWKISSSLGISVVDLRSINNLSGDVIHPGQELKLK